MDLVLAVKAIIMGIVEGLTEFLPISSTGHLILAGSLLDFVGPKVKVFEIAIQTGAMFAILWEYRARVALVCNGLLTERRSQRFVLNLFIAFLPAAVLGLIFAAKINEKLFAPVPVAIAFIVGGFLILWVERRNRNGSGVARVESVDDMTALDALKVGCAQAFALIPGTSRSGASLSRKAATEFSFFLAIPTLLGATVYSIYKARDLLSMSDVPLFLLGGFSAFVSAFLCVRWLLRYISTHDFTFFAYYRIVFGLFVLLSAHYGWVVWAE
jgi:undecaprenyl-diphosphatase